MIKFLLKLLAVAVIGFVFWLICGPLISEVLDCPGLGQTLFVGGCIGLITYLFTN